MIDTIFLILNVGVLCFVGYLAIKRVVIPLIFSVWMKEQAENDQLEAARLAAEREASIQHDNLAKMRLWRQKMEHSIALWRKAYDAQHAQMQAEQAARDAEAQRLQEQRIAYASERRERAAIAFRAVDVVVHDIADAYKTPQAVVQFDEQALASLGQAKPSQKERV